MRYLFILLFLIAVIRYISLGFIVWYEIIGVIGLICFMGCSFILGYCVGKSE